MKSNRKNPSDVKEVLEERLWFNSKVMTNKVHLTNDIWARAGIHKVRDIYTEKGELRLDNIRKTRKHKMGN